VTVLNDDRMKDGPNEVWSPNLVSQTVLEHIKGLASTFCMEGGISCKPEHEYLLSDPTEEAQSWVFMEKKATQRTSMSEKECIQSISLNLLTFDKDGVSRHPNHLDTFRGIQYLLNEKCHITHGKLEEPMATLRLCPETNASNKETHDNIIEFNVSAYTLKTIPNPLQKYFLWAFVDIIPYFFTWLFQTVWYLIYFLMGGLLWNKGGHPQTIQPFSGIKTMPDGKSFECRIMDPILVWRAMAAHHSQFVWYRRLSVMFSRYTYINDLEKVPIDTSPVDDDDEDDIASLPPVVAIKEEDSSHQFLLTPPQMNALREALIPAILHHRPWKRIYSLSRDGDSFVAFQKLLEDWNGKQIGDQSTLLIVKTTAGDMIGGFADVPIIPLASNTIGSAYGSCLFKLRGKTDGDDPIVDVYGKHLSSSKKILFNATRRIIAFGGGDSDGGLDEGFGLCLEDGFARGTTARCAAFCNEPLVSGQDGVFAVLDVEVWGFVFGQF